MADVLDAVSPYSTVPVREIGLSGDPARSDRDSLLSTYKFGAGDPGQSLVITYSFATGSSVWPDVLPYPYTDATPLTDVQQAAVREALAAWSKVANIAFIEVEDRPDSVGVMRFARSDEIEALGIGFYPYLDDPRAGDVWFDQGLPNSEEALRPGTFDFYLLMHEIGHALGLKHPHDGPLTTSFQEDWIGGTVMAYRTFQGQFLDDSLDADIFPDAPMALDVEAIRYLYGAKVVAPGDDIYRFGENERLFTTIVDDGGIDTIDWSNRSDAAVMDLRQGNWSQLGQPYSWPESRFDWGGTFSGTMRTAAGTIIERAIGGSGDDRIIGNGTDNILSGLAGADELRGGGGDDQLSGGAGADNLFGEGGNDQLNGGDAADLLDGGSDIDFLFGGNGADRMGGGAGSDELHGGDGSDILSGSAGDDTVGGGAGDDTLSGGAGSDRMIGGTGRDRFVLDPEANSSDRITDFMPGIDTIVLREGYTTQSFLAAAKGTANGTLFDLADGHDVLVVGVQGATASWFGS